MSSPHGVFCESEHGAFIESPHGVRGCEVGYQVILGTATQHFGLPNATPLEALRTWKNVWLFDQHLNLQVSTLSSLSHSSFFVEALSNGGDFFVNNGRRMTMTSPSSTVWNGTANDGGLQRALALSAKRGRVYTKVLQDHICFDMDNGDILASTTTSNIVGFPSGGAVGGEPVAAPASPWGIYMAAVRFVPAGEFTELNAVDENLSLRWRVSLGLHFSAELAADAGGVVAGGTVDNSSGSPAVVKRYNTDGVLQWTWTDPDFKDVKAVASNGVHVVVATGSFPDKLVLLDAVTGDFIRSATAVVPGKHFQGGLAIGPDSCVFVAARADHPTVPLFYRGLWKYDSELNFVKFAVDLEGGTESHDVRIVQTL